MILEQEQHLQDLLKQWREERHLTVENQRDGLMGNLCEEMAEYYRATNKSEKIDALCDMCVYCINSLNKPIKVIKEDFNFNKLSLVKIDKLYWINNCLSRGKSEKYRINKELYSFIYINQLEIEEMGYDFYECMLETIKEISSRTGHYDENIHKFVKDKSNEAKAKWYKADYEKCRL